MLRFSAAALVVLFHLQGFGLGTPAFPAEGAERAFGWLGPVGWFGWVGVQIFFVISGFVIAASAQANHARPFLINRAIRVFPALWAAALIALAIRLLWGQEPLGELLNAFVRSAILSPQGPYIDGVVWTLVVEAAFYLVIAAVLSVRGMTFSFHREALILGGLSSLFIAVQSIAKVLGWALSETLGRFYWDVALLQHGVFFALGMLIWSSKLLGLRSYTIGPALAFALMGAVQIWFEAKAAYAPLVPVVVWLLGVAWIIASMEWNSGILAGLQRGWVRQLGLMTYPLYLCHFTFGMYLLPMLPAGLPRIALLVLLVAAILGTSYAVMRGPERWLQGRAKRWVVRG